MTYKLLRHKDFTAEWEKLPSAIRDQFKKKLTKVSYWGQTKGVYHER